MNDDNIVLSVIVQVFCREKSDISRLTDHFFVKRSSIALVDENDDLPQIRIVAEDVGIRIGIKVNDCRQRRGE